MEVSSVVSPRKSLKDPSKSPTFRLSVREKVGVRVLVSEPLRIGLSINKIFYLSAPVHVHMSRTTKDKLQTIVKRPTHT